MMRTKNKRTLQQVRKERKLTQKELATLTGLNVCTIRLLEEGKLDLANSKMTTIKAICKALKVSIDELI